MTRRRPRTVIAVADFPSFDRFYRAVNGRDPFPWQRALAERVQAEGWPDAIGVPTGLGKTACIDIAVWALASQADRRPSERTAPTRIWYVVNRRLLVDSATDHAVRLARLLREPDAARRGDGSVTDDDVAALAWVAEALRRVAALGSDQDPLHVTRLRGGADLGARPPDPSQPAIVTATVPMFASRWLFRGFASSRSMRPIDAAHAGIDSLVLLDEAHLSRPLARLAAPGGPVEQCDVGDPGLLLPPGRQRSRLVSLTATGESSGDRFDLTPDDLAHPVVRTRLDAAKPVTLPEPAKDVAAQMAAQAVELLENAGRPASCVVFANTPRIARSTFAALCETLGDGADVVLLTGRVREREAEAIRSLVLDPQRGAPAGRPPDAPRDKHLVVVATQTLEVGADLDFDLLVTQTASVRALVQRFGRLNRLGERNDVARAVVCHPSSGGDDRLYGDEPATVWERLQAANQKALESGETLSLGPAVISEVLGEPADVPERVGELLPHHLWELAKTSVPPVGEAPPRLFYEGITSDPGAVSLAWRSHVPAGDQQLVPALRGAEAVDVPLHEVLGALRSRAVTSVCRVRDDGTTVDHVPLDDLRPGDRIVLPVDAGLYDEHGWNPEATGTVLDVAGLQTRTLALTTEAIASLSGQDEDDALRSLVRAVRRLPDDDEDPDDWAEQRREHVSSLLDWLGVAPGHPWLREDEWREFVTDLRTAEVERFEVPDGSDTEPLTVLRAPQPRRRAAWAGVRADAFDELSFDVDVRSPALADHLEAVGRSAREIASKLGLPDDIVDAVDRAGELHDAGKADPRFQRWLDPERKYDALLAKSSTPLSRREATRAASGWPKGGRHELISARLAEELLDADDEHRDLILHLVASHHGHGRPTVAVVTDPVPTKVRYSVPGGDGAVVVSGDLSVPDWRQPARFRRLCERYGYWGLALLEAVVRQADHAASGVGGAAAEAETGAPAQPVEVV